MSGKNRLFLEDEDWETLFNIIAKYNCKFYAYGSRVKGTHNKFSDIDLCIEGEIDLEGFKEECYNSNLPMKIDVKKIEEFSSDFLKLIEKDFILIN